MVDSLPVVRRATPDDLEAIVEIYLSNARHHATLAPDRYRVPAGDDVRTRFGRMLDDADDEDAHLVAELEGRVVGALDAFRRPDGSPGSMRIPSRSVEFGIGVLEGWRGRGVGQALLAALEDWARDEGLDAIVLDVAVENPDAERLYAKVGYRPLSRSMTKPVRPAADPG